MADCGTVTVLPDVDPGAVALDQCSVSADTIDKAGPQTAEVTATIRNDNALDVAIDATLMVGSSTPNGLNGAVIGAGSSRTFTLTFSADMVSLGEDQPIDLSIDAVSVANTGGTGSDMVHRGCTSCGPSRPRYRRRVSNPLRALFR